MYIAAKTDSAATLGVKMFFFSALPGIWLSAFALGNFTGPTVAGVMVDTEGFPRTTLIFFGLYLIMLLVDIVEALCNSRRSSQQEGYQQIE